MATKSNLSHDTTPPISAPRQVYQFSTWKLALGISLLFILGLTIHTVFLHLLLGVLLADCLLLLYRKT